MPARLVSLDGHADILLDRDMVVVGRHDSCDFRINSIRVSRRHCCLALAADGVLVRDLGSTNGTWINGRPIEDGVLRPGDELTIAHLRYHLEIDPPGQTMPTSLGLRSHGVETPTRLGLGAESWLITPVGREGGDARLRHDLRPSCPISIRASSSTWRCGFAMRPHTRA